MNLEQLNAMTDLEIDIKCAEIIGLTYSFFWSKHNYFSVTMPDGSNEIACRGWTAYDDTTGEKNKLPTEEQAYLEVSDYHPTANTTEGKAQAFDLMDKFNLTIDFDTGLVHWDDGWTIYNANPQRAICEAVILSAQEK